VKKIVIHPITRIEGHLKVEATVDNGIVKDANMSGTMFRGIEIMLEGRDPRDAVMITQRVCGVCPEPHAIAAVNALEDYAGLTDKIPDNGILLRNIILGTRTIADHILHFYILCGLDYLDPTKALEYSGDNPDMSTLKQFLEQGYSRPFLPRDEMDFRIDSKTTNEAVSHYIKALDIYRKAQEAATIFGGKWPNDSAIVGGGVTESLSADKISAFIWRIDEVLDFVKNCYLPDVIAVAGVYRDYLEIGKGCGNLLAYPDYRVRSNGKFDNTFFSGGTVSDVNKYSEIDINRITEDVYHSWYKDNEPVYPGKGKTEPMPDKDKGYSWIKSPRYNSKVYEVGPLASLVATYLNKKDEEVNKLVDSALKEIKGDFSNLYSVMGRHLSRCLMAVTIGSQLKDWALSLDTEAPTATIYEAPEEAKGVGLAVAPRGALGHWLEVKDKRISNYQIITPTAWNASPKDRDGNPGPYEQAIIGTKVQESQSPIEILRIIRSFDPCTACAIHVISAKGNLIGEFKVS
jgi:hydrogenase large subunit